MTLINFEDGIYQAWLDLLGWLHFSGDEIIDERGSVVNEKINVHSVLHNPLKKYYDLKNLNDNLTYEQYLQKYETEHSVWYGDKLINYCKQFIDPKDKGFIYDYGNRLNGYFEHKGSITFPIHQQFESIEDRLINNKNSRRALAITWDPTVDIDRDEVPCLQFIQMLIRDDKLQTTALWRSHDIFGAWFPNLIALSYMAENVANHLGYKVGDIHVHSVSAHYYKTNEQEIEKIIM